MIIHPQVPTETEGVHRQPFTLPRGSEVLVREATTEDADGLRAMFARCSAETIYLRFHLAYAAVPEPLIERLVGATGRGGRAFVAVSGEGIVGHAMYARERDDAGEAEMAVVVEDARQGSGLGGLLLSVASAEARRAGVETLTCLTLWENRRVLDLARRVFGGIRVRYAGGTLSVRVPLRSTATG